METLILALLGKPEVHLGRQPIMGFRSSKALALLCYLAAEPRAHSRHALAGLFWSDDPDAKARNSLRVTLSNLNALCPDHLEVKRTSVRLRMDRPVSVDVATFERLTSSVAGTRSPAMDEADLAAAVALYRDDFLTDLHLDGCPLWDEWVGVQRAHYRQRMQDALGALATRYREERSYRLSVKVLKRLLDFEPWHEEAYRQLMIAHSRMGEFTQSLAVYQRCRQILADQLDLPPMPETEALAERIRLARRSRPHNLPPETTPLIGREQETAQIHALLLDPECRLITITGLGGMGKTHLALTAARQANREQALTFLNGVFFISLAGTRAADGLLPAIGEGLQAKLPGRGRPLDELATHLKGLEILLVLDNLEHMLSDAGPLLAELLRRCPSLKLMVTSREPLALAQAWRLDLAGLALPRLPDGVGSAQPGGDPSLADQPAVQLFVQTAARMRPDFQLDDGNVAAVARLCHLVAGMPLALKLAATWVRLMDVGEIAAELERSLDLLATRAQDLPARQRSMRAVFDATWRLLPVDEQGVMAGLSVFRGGFSRRAAREVVGATAPLLMELVDRGLVVTEEMEGESPARYRYSIHELTRQYAGEQMDATQRQTKRMGHIVYYVAFAEECQRLFSQGAVDVALARMGVERNNIWAAWERLVEEIEESGGSDQTVRLLDRYTPMMANYVQQQALYRQGRDLMARAAAATARADWQRPHGPPGLRRVVHARLQTRLARLEHELGAYDRAESLLEEAVAALAEPGHELDRALALRYLASIYSRLGRYAEARARLHQAAGLYAGADDAFGRAQTFNTLGNIDMNQGHYADAQEAFRRAIALYEKVGYTRGVALALSNTGTTYSRQGMYTQAEPLYQQARNLARQEGILSLTMLTTSNLGGVARGLGDYEAAEERYQESLDMARDMGQRRWIAANLNGLSQTYLEMEQPNAAEQCAREALRVAHAIADEPDALGSLTFLGHLLARRGHIEEALGLLIFVDRHERVMERDRRYISDLLQELLAELPPSVVSRAESWAASQSVDSIVTWLGRDLPRPPLPLAGGLTPSEIRLPGG